jgi:transcription termination factor Rho
MAFKASSRTTSKTAKPKASAKTPKVEDIVMPPSVDSAPEVDLEPVAAPLSIEDMVGAPKEEPARVQEERQPQPQVQPESTNDRYDRQPRSENQPQQGGFRPSYGGGNRGYNGGGGGFRRGPSSFGQNRGGFGQNRGFRDQRSGMRPGFSPQGGQGQGWGDRGGYRRDDWSNNPETAAQDINVPTETVRGILDIMPEGHGFLRPKFTPSDRDVYISQSQIRRFLLRNGDMVEGQARQPKDNERYWGLLKVEKVNEELAENTQTRPRFDDLTAIYPNRQLKLESGITPLSTRILDLIAPIGFGQRALIVSPPKAGKTTILKELAAGIAANYPEVHLMAALIGERPEEVTDLSRSIKGEVLASNFDESPADQTRIAEVALDRAKRLVEQGRDVVVLLDSITRLARAYNLVVNPSGRTLSGGFDPAALYPGKKFLGAARCVEGKDGKSGGSLTVIGTALVDTGSRMDDMIYEEFKGTGNMELHLSRNLQERRVFPAIDVGKSGTRHDELLLGEEKMKQVITLRHMLSLLSDEERTVMLVDRLGKTKSNDEFLESLSQGS